MMNLFVTDAQGMPKFILEDDFNTAFRKKPSEQSNYDKEVISVNDRAVSYTHLDVYKRQP